MEFGIFAKFLVIYSVVIGSSAAQDSKFLWKTLEFESLFSRRMSKCANEALKEKRLQNS